MKTKIILFGLVTLLTTACGSITSVTTIEAKDSFVLGNNPHAPFEVTLKNLSKEDVIVHREPLDGGRHSFETVAPGALVTVKVEENTALVVANGSNRQINVKLFIVGDTGLAMGYKNQ